MAQEELTVQMRALAGASTADLIGIAPGEAFSAEELGELGRTFGPIRSIIVLAMHLVDPVQGVRFDSGTGYDNSSVAASFADALLRDACWRTVEIIHGAGYRAATPRNLCYGDSDPRHSISFKKAGVLAGVGSFGTSQLLIHPQWGPWMRLRTVVTDAALPADAPISFSPCEDCGACLAACPAGALSEAGFERAKCAVEKKGGAFHISPHGWLNCEECMRACPIGTAPPRLAMGGKAE